MNDSNVISNGDMLDEIVNKLKMEDLPEIKNDYLDYYVVSKGDILYKIANDNKLDASMLAQLNGLNENDYIYPNQILLIPRAGSIIYFTAPGDTLVEIARGLGVDVDKLIEANSNLYLQPEQLIIYNGK